MTTNASDAGPGDNDSFRHEAFLYAGAREYIAGLSGFIAEGVRASEAVLAVLDAATIDALRGTLGSNAEAVQFGDMAEVGHNPGRIIEAWRDFVVANRGSRRRGVGEPIWPERTPAELVECQHHESLLNLAFEEAEAFWLLCPYDTAQLEPVVVEQALVSHPYVFDGDGHRPSARFSGVEPAVFAGSLPARPVDARTHTFDLGNLHTLRDVVAECARAWGMTARRTADIVLAVSEIASNSVLYGGGHGVARLWPEGDVLICEISDRGRIEEPLVGRWRPATGEEGGFGVWLANQLCDLVQIRSSATGTTVRLHVTRC